MDKPYETKVTRSKKNAVYIKGIRIFEQKGRIHITSSKGHTYCPKGSSIEKFFRKFLKPIKSAKPVKP